MSPNQKLNGTLYPLSRRLQGKRRAKGLAPVSFVVGQRNTAVVFASVNNQ